MPPSTAARAVRGSAIRDLLALTARPDVISLAGGLPAADLMPRDRIAAATAAALADPAALQYGETAGTARLRDVLAAHESARCGREVRAGNVVVTSGSLQALDLVARAVLEPGDAVVVEDPAYVGALQVFQAVGAALHPVPLDGEGMRIDLLEDRLRDGLRPALVHTVSTFHNPRGGHARPRAARASRGPRRPVRVPGRRGRPVRPARLRRRPAAARRRVRRPGGPAGGARRRCWPRPCGWAGSTGRRRS